MGQETHDSYKLELHFYLQQKQQYHTKLLQDCIVWLQIADKNSTDRRIVTYTFEIIRDFTWIFKFLIH